MMKIQEIESQLDQKRCDQKAKPQLSGIKFKDLLIKILDKSSLDRYQVPINSNLYLNVQPLSLNDKNLQVKAYSATISNNQVLKTSYQFPKHFYYESFPLKQTKDNKTLQYLQLPQTTTICEPYQSQSHITYIFSYHIDCTCMISLAVYNKKQHKFSQECNLLALKYQDEDTNNKYFVVTAKWLNNNVFLCGTNNGYFLLCQPSKLLTYQLKNKILSFNYKGFSKIPGLQLQQVSIAPITQIHIMTNCKIHLNQKKPNQNPYICKQQNNIAALTSHQQIFICGCYSIQMKNGKQKSPRYLLQVLQRLCCLNASMLIEMHCDKNALYTSPIRQSKYLDSILINDQIMLIQGCALGIIKVWKVQMSTTCGKPGCKQFHTVQQYISTYLNNQYSRQHIKVQQAQNFQHNHHQDSIQSKLQNKSSVVDRNMLRQNMQNSIRHNSIIMIDDIVVQGYLPTFLLRDNSYLNNSLNQSLTSFSCLNTTGIQMPSILNQMQDENEEIQQQNILHGMMSQQKSLALTQSYQTDMQSNYLHQQNRYNEKAQYANKKQSLCNLESVNASNSLTSQHNQKQIHQLYPVQIQQINQSLGYGQIFTGSHKSNISSTKPIISTNNTQKTTYQQNSYNMYSQNNPQQEYKQLILPYLPCKHSINPMFMISSLFVDTTLLQLQCYGHLLACVTADGYLSIIALDLLTQNASESIHNYEVLSIYKIFKSKKSQQGNNKNCNQYQYEQFVKLYIVDNKLYFVLNRLKYSANLSTVQFLESYIKTVSLDNYLAVIHAQITLLSLPYQSIQNQLNNKLQQAYLLHPTKINAFNSNSNHRSCGQSCGLSIYSFGIRNCKGFYIFDNILIHSHDEFHQNNKCLSQQIRQQNCKNTQKLQITTSDILAKYF